jgi:PAS domain S-box-containing protein
MPEAWPPTLRTVLSAVIGSAFPTCLFWGDDSITFVNDVALAAKGLPLEAIGCPLEACLPDLWQVLGPAVMQASAGETRFYEDLQITLRRRGYPEPTWWMFSVSPVRDESGHICAAIVIGQETTERILTERRLRFLLDLGAVLRGLFDPCQIVNAVSEALGQHLQAGRAGYVGVSADGQVGTVVGRWTDPSMPDASGSYRLDAFGEGILKDLHAGRVVRIDDAQIDARTQDPPTLAAYAGLAIRASLAVPFMQHGRLAAILYVQQSTPRSWSEGDISLIREVAERTWNAVSRAEAEAALRTSEERFRRFGEFSPHVTWIYNVTEERVEYLSPAYEHVWGEPIEAVLQGPREHWGQTIHPDDREASLTVLGQVLGKWQPVVHEYRIVRPDGSVRRIRDICFPIGQRGEPVLRLGGIAQDITQAGGSQVYLVDADGDARTFVSRHLRASGYTVEEFTAAEPFLRVAPSLMPGCVILNIQSLGTEAFVIPKQIKTQALNLAVLAIDGGNVTRAVQAMKAGALDVLEPPLSTNQISVAVSSALATIQVATENSRTADTVRQRITVMTSRERDILVAMVRGGTSKQIGQRLGLSPRTVEAYRGRVMEKIGAQSLSEAVRLAVAAGLRPAAGDG